MLQLPKHITLTISSTSDLMEMVNIPTQIEAGGFLLCTRGSGEIIIDMKQYRVQQWDLIVAMPYSIVQILSSSDDFEAELMGVSIDFFSTLQLPDVSYYFSLIKDNPSIALTESEAQYILSLRNMLIEGQSRAEHIFRGEIDDAISNIVLYETLSIYRTRKPNVEEQRSRDNTIFYLFISHLFRDYREERSLVAYAQRQQITANHLSKVVKRVSGRSPSEWIVNYTILKIKGLLQSSETPINIIADEFNFANSSFFAQYFKKYTGITPRAYRAKKRSQSSAAIHPDPAAVIA